MRKINRSRIGLVLCVFIFANLFAISLLNAGQIRAHKEGAAVTLSGPGDYDWWYGCSPTSAGMIIGHYDVAGYDGYSYGNLVPGGDAESSTFGVSGTLINAAIASSGHINDFYAGEYLSSGDDLSGPWHSFNSLADFMGTSQDSSGNVNGSTTFYYYTDGARFNVGDAVTHSVTNTSGMYGIGEYIGYAGYDTEVMYNQYIDTKGLDYGFTFEQYKAEIDAGRPVMLHIEGHSMYGYGYDDSINNEVLLHDTWTAGEHSMIWGGTYDSKEHYGVTVMEVIPEPATIGLIALGGLMLIRDRRKKK